MFKKSLTVLALVVGISLAGGIGTTFASGPYNSCESQEPSRIGGTNKYFRYVVDNYDSSFSSAFTENTKFGRITWHLKQNLGSCEYAGRVAFQAYYEGSLN